jgi:hypothetical protein
MKILCNGDGGTASDSEGAHKAILLFEFKVCQFAYRAITAWPCVTTSCTRLSKQPTHARSQSNGNTLEARSDLAFVSLMLVKPLCGAEANREDAAPVTYTPTTHSPLCLCTDYCMLDTATAQNVCCFLYSRMKILMKRPSSGM